MIKPPLAQYVLELIEAETKAIGFSMGSERVTGALLRALAASKPKAKILELGTGTGISAAWLLDGMDDESCLTTVDNDPAPVKIAKRYLGVDRRFLCNRRSVAATKLAGGSRAKGSKVD